MTWKCKQTVDFTYTKYDKYNHLLLQNYLFNSLGIIDFKGILLYVTTADCTFNHQKKFRELFMLKLRYISLKKNLKKLNFYNYFDNFDQVADFEIEMSWKLKKTADDFSKFYRPLAAIAIQKGRANARYSFLTANLSSIWK